MAFSFLQNPERVFFFKQITLRTAINITVTWGHLSETNDPFLVT